MTSQDHKRDVLEILASAGFERVGFASAHDPPGVARYREWIAQGYHGSMDYLERNLPRRLDPQQVQPGIETVIVMATPYDPATPAEKGAGRIAAYAQGEDYHRILERRLKDACAKLVERFEGEGFRYYVDTGPVLEKAWAERAGIGWIGKNTCSIDPGAGSYFLLSVIYTTLSLAADAPAEDLCGRCTLCLDACPTNAFVEPYVLDARRCISYLTIEQRGELATDLEPQMGEWIFGCDICQDVCPWNQKPDSGDHELAAREENRSVDFARVSDLDKDSFPKRFPRSPIRRAKLAGFLRNIIVAIGNTERPDAIELLEKLSTHDDVKNDPNLRRTIERAIRRQGETRSAPG